MPRAYTVPEHGRTVCRVEFRGPPRPSSGHSPVSLTIRRVGSVGGAKGAKLYGETDTVRVAGGGPVVERV